MCFVVVDVVCLGVVIVVVVVLVVVVVVVVVVVLLQIPRWRSGAVVVNGTPSCGTFLFAPIAVSVLFVVFLAAICLLGCAMDPSTQPTDLEVLRRRAAALESENERLREQFALLGGNMATVVRERDTMRKRLQKCGRVIVYLTLAQNDALAVLREDIPAAVSGGDCLSDPSLPNKRRRS